MRELADQAEALGLDPAALLVATGSGGTHAGLLAGASAGEHSWPVIGASVSRPVEECRQRVASLARDCAALLEWPLPDPEVHVRDARGPGFATPSEAGTAMASLALAREGLLLDDVYTAKALAVLPELVADGLDGPVVFWHTGGTGSVCDTLAGSAPQVSEVGR